MLMTNHLVNGQTPKHVDLRQQMVRDINYNKGISKLRYNRAEHSIADIMTKVLDKVT